MEQYEIGGNVNQWKEISKIDEPRSGYNFLIMDINLLSVLLGYNYRINTYVNSICYIN